MTKPIRIPAEPPSAELLAALALHQEWLSSNHREGRRLRLRDAVGVDLHGVNMRSADMNGANLVLADLGSADLSFADLRHADLGLADLRRARLHRADLASAVLVGTELIEADLSEADLDGVWAFATDFTGADLADATLRGATLDVSKRDDSMSRYLVSLHGAALRGFQRPLATTVTQRQLDRACGDQNTVLPGSLQIAACEEEPAQPGAE